MASPLYSRSPARSRKASRLIAKYGILGWSGAISPMGFIPSLSITRKEVTLRKRL